MENSIFPALLLFPMMIISLVHENQDRVKGVPKVNRNNLIFSSMSKLVTKIIEGKPNEEIYKEITKK
jgi:hypothetical protein